MEQHNGTLLEVGDCLSLEDRLASVANNVAEGESVEKSASMTLGDVKKAAETWSPLYKMGKTEYPACHVESNHVKYGHHLGALLEVENLHVESGQHLRTLQEVDESQINSDLHHGSLLDIEEPHAELEVGDWLFLGDKLSIVVNNVAEGESIDESASMTVGDVKKAAETQSPIYKMGKTEYPTCHVESETPIEGMKNVGTPATDLKKAETLDSLIQPSPGLHLIDTMTPTESGSKVSPLREKSPHIPSKRVVRILFTPRETTPKKHWIQKAKTDELLCLPGDNMKNCSRSLNVTSASNKMPFTRGYFWVYPAEFKSTGGQIHPTKNTWRLYCVVKYCEPLCILVPDNVQINVQGLRGAAHVMLQKLGYPAVTYKVHIFKCLDHSKIIF